MDLTHLKLQFLVCARDAEIAALKQDILVGQMRDHTGASKAAQFHAQTMSFVEPPATERPPLDLGALDA